MVIPPRCKSATASHPCPPHLRCSHPAACTSLPVPAATHSTRSCPLFQATGNATATTRWKCRAAMTNHKPIASKIWTTRRRQLRRLQTMNHPRNSREPGRRGPASPAVRPGEPLRDALVHPVQLGHHQINYHEHQDPLRIKQVPLQYWNRDHVDLQGTSKYGVQSEQVGRPSPGVQKVPRSPSACRGRLEGSPGEPGTRHVPKRARAGGNTAWYSLRTSARSRT
jgi:hypothetical protein